MTAIAKFVAAVIVLVIVALPWYLYLSGRKRPAAPPYDPEKVSRVKELAVSASVRAVAADTVAVARRPKVREAEQKAHDAVETRIASGITWADLPKPAADENEAITALVAELTHQTALEAERGDAWMEAAFAAMDAARAATEQLEATAKKERRRGLKWGLGIGAGVVVLAVVLL